MKDERGQYFLNDDWCSRVPELAGVHLNTFVVEIGAGTGQLTTHLLEAGAHVLAIEQDDVLFDKLLDAERLIKLCRDARDVEPELYQVWSKGDSMLVCNPPFMLTGFIMRLLMRPECQWQHATLLLTCGTVRGMCTPGDTWHGFLRETYNVVRGPEVSRDAFTPKHDVDCQFVKLNRINK